MTRVCHFIHQRSLVVVLPSFLGCPPGSTVLTEHPDQSLGLGVPRSAFSSPQQRPLLELLWHRPEAAGPFSVLPPLAAAPPAMAASPGPVLLFGLCLRSLPWRSGSDAGPSLLLRVRERRRDGSRDGTGREGGRGAAAGALRRTVTCQRLDEKREPLERRSRSQRRRRASMIL